MDADLIPTSWEKRGNIITVVGVGGGGSNAVSYMYSLGLKDVDFVICNTDVQALQSSPVPNKLQIGAVLTKGLGAGTDYNVGRKAAQESIDEINRLFEGDTQMVFVTCGMGGGTGTGAAPVVAAAAKEQGKLTVGVVTVPFRDEGKEALYRAVEGIKELSKHVDSILIIDNQKLYQLYGEMNIFTAFPKADEVLATAVRSIAEIITSSGYINVDFADVKRVMQNSGVAIMGIGEAEGPDRATKAVEMALKSPLLNDLNLKSVKNALVNITSSSDPEHGIKMSELSQIMDFTEQYTGATINFKRGIVKNDEMGERISVTIIATGFEMWQLPVIDENEINRGNRIDVKLTRNLFQSRKKGRPVAPDNDKVLNKQRVTGTPALIAEDAREIRALEEEPAYFRRERMLNTKEAAGTEEKEA
ncbi:MAG: cell division protein FtsZ [Bacteroidales bacterium]|nr:cell division protein FtsZ [Bacteroidales bacterium]